MKRKRKGSPFKRSLGNDLCVAYGETIKLKRAYELDEGALKERLRMLAALSRRIREAMLLVPEVGQTDDPEAQNTASYQSVRARDTNLAMGFVATFAALIVVLIVMTQREHTTSVIQSRTNALMERYTSMFSPASVNHHIQTFHDQKSLAEKKLVAFAKNASQIFTKNASKKDKPAKGEPKSNASSAPHLVQDSAAIGYRYMVAGRHQEAIPYFASILRKDPNNVLVRRYLAHSLSSSGQFALAARQFAELSLVGPLCRYDKSAYAHSLYCAGQKAQSARIYHELLSEDNKDFSARMKLAKIYLTTGEHDRCKAVIKEGAELAESPEQLHKLGVLLSCAEQRRAGDAVLEEVNRQIAEAEPNEAVATKPVESNQ